MRSTAILRLSLLANALTLAILSTLAAQTPSAPTNSSSSGPSRVTLGEDGRFRRDGKPMLPVLALNQPVDAWPELMALGVNTFVAERRPTPKTTVQQYLKTAERLQAYVILPAAWIDEDKAAEAVAASTRVLAVSPEARPDHIRLQSDAVAEAPEARFNAEQPLSLLFDGDEKTWVALDPVRAFAVTVNVSKSAMTLRGDELVPPVVSRVGVMQRKTTEFLSQPKSVEILLDGHSQMTAELATADGRLQQFDLPQPVAARSLTVKVLSVHDGRDSTGAWAELQLLTADGTNVLASPVRYQPQREADAVAAECRQLRQRWKLPVMVTVTPALATLPTLEPPPHSPGRAYYRRALSECDLATTSLLPLDLGGKSITLDSLLLKQMTDLDARPKCFGTWIAVGCPHPERALSGARAPSPMEVRAAVVLSLLNGAAVVPYFTQRLTPGQEAPVDVPDMNRDEMKRLAALMPRLAEIVALPDGQGPRWAMATEPSPVPQPPVRQTVRQDVDGAVYLLVVNPTDRPVEAALDMGGPRVSSRLFDDPTVPVRIDAGTARTTMPPWYAEVYKLTQ
jgi:hypothetical protein